MAGDECPVGSFCFQTTFSDGPTRVGSGLSDLLTPEEPGPRNCGQSSPKQLAAEAMRAKAKSEQLMSFDAGTVVFPVRPVSAG